MTGSYLSNNNIAPNANMYEANYFNAVKADEHKRGIERYDKAKRTHKTGVVPSPFSSSLLSNVKDYNDMSDNSGTFISSLSGEKINAKEFKHNNMQPFIRGNITQNTNVEKFTSRLDNYTGNNSFYQNKKEVENIYKPVSGFHNINGSKIHTDFYKERLQSEMSNVHNNISPIQKTYVGPGLNQGYSSQGVGGFQQYDTLDYARPKTLDELRSKVNQKNSTYEIPIKAPPKATEQRGIVAPSKKNRPERIYNTTEDNFFRTTGAYLKDASRSEIAIKKTYRPDTHHEYSGTPVMQDRKGMSIKDDYGKNNIVIYDNERQETETKTSVTNATSIVKSMISPILDALKYSLKEYTVDAVRNVGNPNAQIPNKLTTHDPSDVMKTTVKETVVEDDTILNLTGHDGTYSAAQDIAKTTVKETLIHDADNLNIKTSVNYAYTKGDDVAKKTIKETLPIVDTMRNIGGKNYKTYVYDSDNVNVKKTVKETTIKGSSELGFIGGILNGIIGGYISNEIDLKNSHKQFTVDNENIGIAMSINDHRQTSREAEENALTNGARESLLISAGHTPNAGRMNIPIDKDDVNVKTNKLIEDSYSARDAGNVNVIYQQSPEINECSITREVNQQNAFDGRLDATTLSSLTTNDYNININPIVQVV